MNCTFPGGATRRTTCRLLAALAIVTTLQLASAGSAEAAPLTGLTTGRIVLKDASGATVMTLRMRAPELASVNWEKVRPGQQGVSVKVLDRSAHVLWFLDARENTELRVDFPELTVRGRAASAAFPNPNPWQALPYAASVFASAAPEAPPTGLTITRFELRNDAGNVVATYRQRSPVTAPPTWETRDPGQPLRGAIRVVDRTTHVLWLFDPTDNAELRIEFPSLAIKGRPGSTQVPNPSPWSTLPLRVDTGAAGATQPADHLTFRVHNASGETVELFQASTWPPTAGAGVVVDVIPNGQSRAYTAGADLGWVIRRAALGKAELQRFKVTSENQLITVGPAAAPTPPAAPARQMISVTTLVPLITGWPHISGDRDMDTNGQDRVPVEVRSRLSYSGEGVYIEVYFRCQEYRGDGTAYGGIWRKYDIATKANGKIPAGATVLGIRPRGGPERHWSVVSVGRQHGPQTLNTRGTYWDDLYFVVDHAAKDDGGFVGVSGTVTLTVEIQR
jgi:hypothetical protein